MVDVEGHHYIVTANHVVREQVLVEVAIPNAVTGELHDPVPVTGWTQPFEQVDLSLAPLPDLKQTGMTLTAIELSAQAIPNDSLPNLGQELFYIGIFAPQETSMVRAGTLGSPRIPIRKGPTAENPTLYEYEGWLMDCRSYDGFSGSPCFALLQYADLSKAGRSPVPAPPEMQTGDLVELSSLAVLLGMFTAHYDDEDLPGIPGKAASRYGVGVMLPVDYIRKALMAEDAKAQRAKRDAERAAAKKPGPELARR